jgi:hypothetical protein
VAALGRVFAFKPDRPIPTNRELPVSELAGQRKASVAGLSIEDCPEPRLECGVERLGHVRIIAAVSRRGTLRLASGGHLKRPRLEALDDLAQSRDALLVSLERAPAPHGGRACPLTEADERFGTLYVPQEKRRSVETLTMAPFRHSFQRRMNSSSRPGFTRHVVWV